MKKLSRRGCPFCALNRSQVFAGSRLAVAIKDFYPISPGHALIIPRRHIASFFEATKAERAALFSLLDRAKRKIVLELQPNGYNIGVNDGAAAGQTVPHLHIHLIPRFNGDCRDPRGGVRWLFPEKADYWSRP